MRSWKIPEWTEARATKAVQPASVTLLPSPTVPLGRTTRAAPTAVLALAEGRETRLAVLALAEGREARLAVPALQPQA